MHEYVHNVQINMCMYILYVYYYYIYMRDLKGFPGFKEGVHTPQNACQQNAATTQIVLFPHNQGPPCDRSSILSSFLFLLLDMRISCLLASYLPSLHS